MGYRRDPFMPNEWYHCYNRGVDKRTVFESAYDYERFLEALYLCNDIKPKRSHVWHRNAHQEIMESARHSRLVSIAAYCLMPTHFHLLVREASQGGISTFMHKLGTAYTMYFNTKSERVGNLFVKPFRSKRISSDGHFLHLPNYIHLNPAELFEPEWKRGVISSIASLEISLKEYRYSSLSEYRGIKRIEGVILDAEAVDVFRSTDFSLRSAINDAAEYYRDLVW